MQRNLRYLLDANIAPQWRDWLAELAPALAAELGEANAWALMRRTGAAVAARRRLRPCASLNELEAAIGHDLRALNWGWCRLSVGPGAIDIVHGAYPFAPAPNDPAGGWFAAVLEGLYTEWLCALSGDRALRARATVRPESLGDVIRLRYGRHRQ